jgi:hypothetical protein
MSIYRAFRRLSWGDCRLLVEAVLCIAVARLWVVLVPLRLLSAHLGRHGGESSMEAHSDETARMLAQIMWSLKAISHRLPWRCACIEQGIAAKMMLRSRRIASTLYLGVARAPTTGSQPTAHAWLRSGPLLITGAPSHEQYTVVSSFADDGYRCAHE